MMNTLVINRSTVSKLLPIGECITAVEQAFKMWALGQASPPGILGIHAADGGFHTKAGILNSYFVSKTNANFPKNRELYGLPTIQGIVSISDATNGRLLALMDSIEITIIRTGAATAVAAKYLSRQDSSVLTICGCGNQGYISVRAICEARPIKKVFLYDTDLVTATKLSERIRSEFKIDTHLVNNIQRAAKESDIIVTCTPSTKPILFKEDVSPGTFIAAVGTDSDTKHEIDPGLLSVNKLVVDSIEQCLQIGDLHHAVADGFMKRESVHADLGQVIAGLKPGRTSESEIIIFDSTGTGLQDVAAASIVYERAMNGQVGLGFDFSG